MTDVRRLQTELQFNQVKQGEMGDEFDFQRGESRRSTLLTTLPLPPSHSLFFFMSIDIHSVGINDAIEPNIAPSSLSNVFLSLTCVFGRISDQTETDISTILSLGDTSTLNVAFFHHPGSILMPAICSRNHIIARPRSIASLNRSSNVESVEASAIRISLHRRFRRDPPTHCLRFFS